MSDGGFCHYCQRARCICDEQISMPRTTDCPLCGQKVPNFFEGEGNSQAENNAKFLRDNPNPEPSV